MFISETNKHVSKTNINKIMLPATDFNCQQVSPIETSVFNYFSKMKNGRNYFYIGECCSVNCE